ncbi:MAG: cyanophycin synthetase [Proteobacteria bacterium]|nr:MAG: cyanophycin synthetase [Pseudomonadota bacterium]
MLNTNPSGNEAPLPIVNTDKKTTRRNPSRRAAELKIESIRAIHGPNTFHHKPVLVMTLNLGKLTNVSSREMDGFTDRLLHLMPGLWEHRCSPRRYGGFVERLHRGTYLGHIVEHIALELSRPAGIEVNYGKTIYAGRPGFYQVAVRFESERGMELVLRTAVDIARAIISGASEFPIEEEVKNIRGQIAASNLGPSTRAIVDAAEKRNIPWQRLDEFSTIQLGYGKEKRLIQATTTGDTSNIAVEIAQDKGLTKRLLQANALPTPAGLTVKTAAEAVAALKTLGAPVVVKPLDGNHGNGVQLHLRTEAEVRQAFGHAASFARHGEVLIEQQFVGRDYRLVVVGGKLIAAAERVPAHVVGDGALTLEALIAAENVNPLRGEGHEKPMTKIHLDECSRQCLARQGLSLASVPAYGETIYLRETANLSTGGCAVDVTEQVHPEVKAVAERAARLSGLDICGIDFISEDIAKPMAAQTGGIIELNAGPGIRMHHFPSRGRARDVGGAIVDHLYPAGKDGRIPIISITGTNGKTTVTRLVSHIMGRTGKVIGTTTTDGILINGMPVAFGDTTGPVSAKAVLSDPAVEVAVLETARGGIVRRGLGYDWSDVGVITNVQLDHIGQDGIEDREDVLRIKSLVAERVRPGGAVVLNVDDDLLAKLGTCPSLKDREIVYFSTEESSMILRKHRNQGKRVYYIRDGWLCEGAGAEEIRILRAADLPFAFYGTARFQLANALAATAAARAIGVPVEVVRDGLSTFSASKHNAGRANFYRVGNGFLMVDYGHNPEAVRAVAGMTAKWAQLRVTGVIAVPGDRSDELVKECARAAAEGFDRLIVREDMDLRGRRPGEVAALICDEVRSGHAGPPVACEIALDPRAALEKALDEMEPGEIVVYFYEDLETVESVMASRGGTAIDDLAEIGFPEKPKSLLGVG